MNTTYEPKPGDRFRAEIDVKGHPADPDYRAYQIDMGTAELIEPAKSPGERAYEAAHGDREVHIAWDFLADGERARWERIADAARS